MKKLSYEQTRQMLLHVTDKIITAKPMLTEIDSKIGDGDHGIGMEVGMKKAQAKLATLTDGTDVYQLFKQMGSAMLLSMGGASGVIFGTLFMGGAKNKEPQAECTCALLTGFLRESMTQIKNRGKAEPGDKTMIDALEPAVCAAERYTGDDLTEMLLLAENAAAQGVEATKAYEAKFGRAKSLMERAIGYQDAGATSTWLILQAMREYTQEAAQV